jgi:hypothetical protein
MNHALVQPDRGRFLLIEGVKRMNERRDFLKLGGLLGALGLVRQARAEENEAKYVHTPAGSWLVDIVYENTSNNLGSQGTSKTAMCQFFDDGRWIGSVSAVKPGSSESWPAQWRQQTYHGEWRRHGSAVSITANRMRTDDMGNYVANAATEIQATLASDGQAWNGTFKTISRALASSGSFSGALTATRM